MEEPALYLPDGDGFVGTLLTQGGWDPGAQNGAVVLALLGHCLEDVPTLAPMSLARLTVDLMRPVPIGTRLVVRPTVVREGKKLQVVLLELLAHDVVHVRATALRTRVEDLGEEGVELLEGTPSADPAAQLPPPEECDRLGEGPGAPGFLRGIELRRVRGKGVWLRLAVPVVAEQPIRATSCMTVGFDFAQLINADVERAMPTMTMINPDVTAHVLRPPTDAWIAVTGETRFHAALGRGISSAVLSGGAGTFAVASTSQLVQRR
ncbi:MAG: hypothetical protein JWO68_3464 [Actinomycetia bacterium]|nr:hypothetical protein [Actinomycetes bacterium]